RASEMTVSGAPVAVLPMRLNGDAVNDLVVLAQAANPIQVMMGTPSAIITVNSAADTNVRDNELTLREAILLANGELLKLSLTPSEQVQVNGTPAPGLDEVRFNIQSGNRPEEGATEPERGAVIAAPSTP